MSVGRESIRRAANAGAGKTVKKPVVSTKEAEKPETISVTEEKKKTAKGSVDTKSLRDVLIQRDMLSVLNFKSTPEGEKVFSGRVYPHADQNGILIKSGTPTGTYYELDYGRKAN